MKSDQEDLEPEFAAYVDIDYTAMASPNFNWALTDVESEVVKQYLAVRRFDVKRHSLRRIWLVRKIQKVKVLQRKTTRR